MTIEPIGHHAHGKIRNFVPRRISLMFYLSELDNNFKNVSANMRNLHVLSSVSGSLSVTSDTAYDITGKHN